MDGSADLHAERTVLSGIFRHGLDTFLDICPYITSATAFSDTYHQVIFKCVQEIYEGCTAVELDIPTIISAASKLNLGDTINSKDGQKYLKSLQQNKVNKGNILEEAKTVARLYHNRALLDVIGQIQYDMSEYTGRTALTQKISSAVEAPLYEFISQLISGEDKATVQIGEGSEEWLENILDNPRDNIGIPSPYQQYNQAVGGGYRRKTVQIVGARPKTGKSVFGMNNAIHVAHNLKIPVFYLDTEMSQYEVNARMLALITGIPITRIEMGLVSEEEANLLRVRRKLLDTMPFYYESATGNTFEEHLMSMRRWIMRHVPLDENGVRKDGLIIYDYLQMTDPREFSGTDFKEYQLLGFQMKGLLALASQFDIPILSLLQTNREGITKETTGTAAGSDRIIWKCSAFSILKQKGEEEIEIDGDLNGTHKLIPIVSRHGPGLAENDYISINFNKETAKMVEKPTRNLLKQQRDTLGCAGQHFEIENEQE